MKFILKKMKDSSFLRNVTVLATGTASAQAISLASSPLITRLYGPEAFGVMGVFMAIAQIFIPIAALTYPIAIVLPKDDKNAKSLIKLSIYTTLVFAIVVSVILLLFNKLIIKFLHLQSVSSYLFLIPLVILAAGLMQSCKQWLIRTKQFSINAKVSFLQSAITNGSKISIGFFYPLSSVLISLTALGNGLKAFLMFVFIRRSNYKVSEDIKEQDLSIRKLAKKYRDFPFYRAPETLVNAISQRSPVLMLTAFFGPTAAGFYTLGNRVLQQPITLIGKSVGDVFYPRISEAANNKENLTRLIIKATLALSGVGLIPFGIIILLGPWLFTLIFGSDWLVAGQYAQWVALFLFCEFINKPSVKSLPVLNSQFFHLIFTIATLFVRIIALAVGYFWFDSDLIAIALFSVSSAVMHVLLILLVLKRSKFFDMQNYSL